MFLLILILVLGDVVGTIPMAALVAIMIMVSVGTFDWHSIHPRTLKFMPLSETVVMLVTVAATLATSNLAVGVVLGVITAMITFARRVAHLASVEQVSAEDTTNDGQVDTPHLPHPRPAVLGLQQRPGVRLRLHRSGRPHRFGSERGRSVGRLHRGDAGLHH